MNEVSKSNKPLLSEIIDYNDYNMNVRYRGYNQLHDTDKVEDVIVDEHWHLTEESGCYEEWNDVSIELVVANKDGDTRKVIIAYHEPAYYGSYELMDEIEEKYNRKPTRNEYELFYSKQTDDRYFQHLRIFEKLTVQQAIDMLKIMKKKREEIAFNYADEGAILKSILGVSGIFYSKNALPIKLLNEFLERGDDAPTFTNMLERKQEEAEYSGPVAKIVSFHQQPERGENNGEIDGGNHGQIIDISSFKKRR